MQLKKLDQSFYTENTHLDQALDNIDGSWAEGKVRGYGVVLISIKSLSFGIPLRSRIRHKANYITARSNERGIQGKGLDFSKAVLLTKPTYVSNQIYLIPDSEHKKLLSKEVHITNKFEKYVSRYIHAVNAPDHNILSSPEYRFTTLQHYHFELGL